MNEDTYLLTAYYDCSSISQLPAVDKSSDISSDTVFIVSQPNVSDTPTGFLSRQVRMDQITKFIDSELSVEEIREKISPENIVYWDDLSTYGTIRLSDDGGPFMVSAIVMDHGMLSSLEGMYLSDGIDEVTEKRIPNHLSTGIWYDKVSNGLVFRNDDGRISSFIDRYDIISDFYQDSVLSNVTISKDGTKLYLHFVIEHEGQTEDKKITVNLSNMITPYEFTHGVKSMLPIADEGKLSVTLDYDYISSDMRLVGYHKPDTDDYTELSVTPDDTIVTALGKIEKKIDLMIERFSNSWVILQEK